MNKLILKDNMTHTEIIDAEIFLEDARDEKKMVTVILKNGDVFTGASWTPDEGEDELAWSFIIPGDKPRTKYLELTDDVTIRTEYFKDISKIEW